MFACRFSIPGLIPSMEQDEGGGIQDFWKGGSYVYRCGGFALLILSHFLKYPMKIK